MVFGHLFLQIERKPYFMNTPGIVCLLHSENTIAPHQACHLLAVLLLQIYSKVNSEMVTFSFLYCVSSAQDSRRMVNVFAACWGEIISQLLESHRANYCERVFVHIIWTVTPMVDMVSQDKKSIPLKPSCQIRISSSVPFLIQSHWRTLTWIEEIEVFTH